MIFILDNYDSFTWNLVQYFGEFEKEIEVIRNDQISIEELKNKKPDGIVISPGPKTPKEAGISVDIIREIKNIPVLGVCLGHQSIGEAFGGRIVHAPVLMHGKTSTVLQTIESLNKDPLFRDIPEKFLAVRYHSLVIEPETLPESIEVLAETRDYTIMAVKVKDRNTWGLQFHPESILTENGMKFIENFYRICVE